MGLAKRRLYKPERRAARKKSALGIERCAPVACPDASGTEVAKALTHICRQVGVIVGQAAGYDALKDQYTVVAKHFDSGKVGDFQVAGEEVAAVIRLARIMAGGRLYRPWEKALPGLPG